MDHEEAPHTAPQAPPEPPPEQPLASEDRPRRGRGRTPALIGAAAVLGVVAGLCTGYVVQAGRAPDPLPPLAQQKVTQAKGGKAPEALSAAQDRRVRTDGDLRKLLVPRPSGAQKSDAPQGWVDQFGFAADYDRPADAFRDLSADSFRRAATVSWQRGQSTTAINLVQFRETEHLASQDYVSVQGEFAVEDSGNDGEPVPGSSEGRVYVYDRPETEPGYLPMYMSRTLAARGDIVMDIWMYDTKPISKKSAMDLAKRQLERL
ncbi:hypothetical protein ABII15_20805 [Streptomyces sp. HUAS MG91]|uniref:Serine/threonine protein kinase n=1 Tax=Streptomyces tabacisoli TaxID=3156398 RepID=A0AAU8IVK0_9ACTN